MTIEYVLLLIVLFMFGLKAFFSAPAEAFRTSGPRLAARIEQQLATGETFKDENGTLVSWDEQQ